ncbi:MAG: choice-of-anchor J domain-containing protein, partial [Candidatus Latescibacteria bacterium]|nr:choice-of-anchor J domain-containing protein [Candidatus Latescibacterota bacterium]
MIIICSLSPIFLNGQDYKWIQKSDNLKHNSSQLLLSEGFNSETFPPLGWQNIIIAGWNNWERKTSNIYPTCTPYEGSGMASFPSYFAPDGSMARLISPPIDLGTTPSPCTLKFAMFHDDGYSGNPDSVKIEYSTDGINFNRVTAFRRYQPYTGWTDRTVYLGTFTGTIYIGILAFSDYGNNINIDYIRLFGNQIVNDVGVDTIISPGNIHINNTPMTPIGRVKNYGTTAQTNFPVICSIFGSTGILINTSTVIIPNLASNDTIQVTFDSITPADTMITIIMRTNLAGDQNPANDRKIRITSILPTLMIISPNGGEYWAGGTYQQIRWQRSAPFLGRYLLLLSQNSGATFSDTIADNI